MKKTIQLLKECTILYVENDQKTSTAMLHLYQSIFKKVYFTNNGKDALEIFKRHHDDIDLTITEVSLPIMTGLQLVSNIRAKYGYKYPVIFTTNKTDDDTLLRCLKLGATDFIIKPILHKTHLGVLIKVLKPIYDTKMTYLMNQELEIYKTSADCQLLISKTDLDGVITYVNDDFCKISQYTQNELIGKTHNILKHPTMKDNTFRDLWHTIICGNIWSGRIQNRAKDGSSIYLDAKIYPIKNSCGCIVEFICFRQNITEYINMNNKAKELLKKTKFDYSNIYEDSIEKAKALVEKDLKNLEYIINILKIQ